MKKLLLAFVLLLSLTLVGCSNNDSEIEKLEQRVNELEAQPKLQICFDNYLCYYNDETWIVLAKNNAWKEELENYYTKEELEDVLIAIQELQERTTFEFEFSDEYEYWLVVITSREPSDDFSYKYGIQELNDDTYTVYVESNDLFSVGELVLGVEIDNNTLLLVDFEN